MSIFKIIGMKKYLAHISQDKSLEIREHDLIDHLRDVALQAKRFAEKFKSGDWAYTAGIWHDLGKFSPKFQSYIKSANGYDSEPISEGSKGRVDHSTAGAIHSIVNFQKTGRILAYLIAGHHTGLPDWHSEYEGRAALSVRLDQKELLEIALLEEIPPHILNLPLPQFHLRVGSIQLWIRMLFSCLVDADFLDTEKFMSPENFVTRQGYPPLEKLKIQFDAHMKRKIDSSIDSLVNRCRKDILRQCNEKASWEPGLYSLTVPTGGGKTLSSMSFALAHAIQHKKNRIIYVIPYTSIIEQTVDIYREIFGEVVIEHHSNLDPEKNSIRNRLAAENWDAPIIVTTNVQFFESLFAARTSRVRKLHNIAHSVVIFDEAQQLPTDFLQPILGVIQELSEKYGVTFVFATATQPTLIEKKSFDWEFKGLKKVIEIIENVKDVYTSLKRVEIVLPTDFQTQRTWDNVADELKKHKRVLCIVNSRRDCLELFSLMPEGTIHLSALMCGEHRSNVIKEIKLKLSKGEPIRVISTQLVEAGVDIDFPVVYRALAGLDSISQSAGRCNREGHLQMGQVYLFIPPKPAPAGTLRKQENITRKLLQQEMVDPLDPETFNRYFEELYYKANSLDKHNIHDLLSKDERDLNIQFRTAASLFKIIDDTSQAPVIVTYSKSKKFIDQINPQAIDKALLRKLQRYTVTIPKHTHQALVDSGHIKEIEDTGIFVQTVESLYDPITGFLGGFRDSLDPGDFII